MIHINTHFNVQNSLLSKQLYHLSSSMSTHHLLSIPNEQMQDLDQIDSTRDKGSPSKIQEQTAIKRAQNKLDQNQNGKIRNFIFSLFKQEKLRGLFKVQNFNNLEVIEVVLFHKINQNRIQETLRLTFGQDFPEKPPKLEIHSCNMTARKPQYVLPDFLSFHQLLAKEKWTQDTMISDVIAGIYENIDNFHKSEIQRLLSPKKSSQQIESEQLMEIQGRQEEERSAQRSKKQRRKNSSMTGCADKQLTETKNLNRHFRSKLRQVLRELAPNVQDQNQDYKFIDQIFTPNRVGFQDIRKALNNRWFNQGVRRQMNSGQFLHKILRGMMGIKSKKLMIKYYHVMVCAAEEPNSFIRWKYD